MTSGLATSPVQAAGFRPITDAEKAQGAPPYDPEAAAVVLFRSGELQFMDFPTEASSRFQVEVRLKVLTEAGIRFGEVEIPHSRFFRLKNVEGRTVLPDGRVVELPKDAVFEQRRSRSEKYFVTKLAFPAVEVGAILDYRYDMRWDSLFFLEPWYFAGSLPALESEITYIVPGNLSVKRWWVSSTRNEIKTELERGAVGRRVRVWMENVRAIPEEPSSLPVRALSSRIMMIPVSVMLSGSPYPLLDSWKSACELFRESHNNFVGRKSKTKKEAAELAAGQPSLRASIDAIYRFVRDEIRTLSTLDFGVDEGRRADLVLTERAGSELEKALLLRTMLETLKLKPDLIWATRRSEGGADLTVANPWWFDRSLVRVEVEGQQVFLDPSDRGLAMGRLAPDFEGTQALVFHHRKPEVIVLPSRPFDDNTRRAELDLALDPEGRVRGSGSLQLLGHHAWVALRSGEDEEARLDYWSGWLEDRFPGYGIDDVGVEERVEEQMIRVGWSMAQREEEVLGDEASVIPSRPLGPVGQPFALDPSRRATPVLMPFADRDEVVLELAWPAGWDIEITPQDRQFDSSAGSLAARLEVDKEQRRLRYTRRVDVRQTLFPGQESYKTIRDLFDWVVKSDAQRLVLVSR